MFKFKLGLGQSWAGRAKAPRTASNLVEAIPTGSQAGAIEASPVVLTGREPSIVPGQAIPGTEAHSAKEHAKRLLNWLQTEGGRTGMVPANELEEIHAQMCFALNYSERPWVSVAREFRKLTGGKKDYAYIGRVRTVVYNIPSAAQSMRAVKPRQALSLV